VQFERKFNPVKKKKDMWIFDIVSELARTAVHHKVLTTEQKTLDKEIEDFMTFYMTLVDKISEDKSPQNIKKVDEEYMERVQKLSPKAYQEIKQSFEVIMMDFNRVVGRIFPIQKTKKE
jgi:uncharacterized protein (UPF0147 family)